jgi:hypothetical protein
MHSSPLGGRALLLAGLFFSWLSTFAIGTTARAAFVPVDFFGPAQDFSATATLTGNFVATGSGATKNLFNQIAAFAFTPPLTHPLALNPSPVQISTDPMTFPFGTTLELVGLNLLDMQKLNVDFLNGGTAPISLDTINLTTNAATSLLQNLSIDIGGTLSKLTFTQTGAPTITGSGGSGTFSVPGDFGLTLSDAKVTLLGILPLAIPDLSGSFSQALTGTWSLAGSNSNLKVALDGAYSIASPLELKTAFGFSAEIPILLPGLTVSSTLDLAASLNLALSYHLEQSGIIVPEPGAVVLLGLGLLCCCPMFAKRWRR